MYEAFFCFEWKVSEGDGLRVRVGRKVLKLAWGRENDVGEVSERFEPLCPDDGRPNRAVDVFSYSVAGSKPVSGQHAGQMSFQGLAQPLEWLKAAASGPEDPGTQPATPLVEPEAGQALEPKLEALSVHHKTAEQIQKLPHDIGWLLVTARMAGVVMPGVLGLPFLVLGGLVLLPATNRRAERWLTGHSPKVFKGSIRQINRFLDALEHRYPGSGKNRIR